MGPVLTGSSPLHQPGLQRHLLLADGWILGGGGGRGCRGEGRSVVQDWSWRRTPIQNQRFLRQPTTLLLGESITEDDGYFTDSPTHLSTPPCCSVSLQQEELLTHW